MTAPGADQVDQPTWDGSTDTTVRCQMCLEPGQVVDGAFVHQFTGNPRCTYKSHL